MVVNFLMIVPTECDCCNEMVESFFADRRHWWGKYFRGDEKHVCITCLESRAGFTEEYLERVGVMGLKAIKAAQEAWRLHEEPQDSSH